MGHNDYVCTFFSNEAVEALVPLSRRLFQSKQWFSSTCIPYSLCLQFEPHRLNHIDLLIKIAMKKGSFYIEMVKVQLVLCYQCQQNSNWRVLYNRGEYLVVVNSFSLCVTFHHQPGFVVYNIFLERFLFLCIYPLTANCLLSFGQLYQFPSVVLV